MVEMVNTEGSGVTRTKSVLEMLGSDEREAEWRLVPWSFRRKVSVGCGMLIWGLVASILFLVTLFSSGVVHRPELSAPIISPSSHSCRPERAAHIFFVANLISSSGQRNHWFHVGESILATFLSQPPQSAATHNTTYPCDSPFDVYFAMDHETFQQFTPMTRMLAAAGVDSPCLRSVHFASTATASLPREHTSHTLTNMWIRERFTIMLDTQSPDVRFLHNADRVGMGAICGTFEGTVGHEIVPRQHWFKTSNAFALRSTFKNLCAPGSDFRNVSDVHSPTQTTHTTHTTHSTPKRQRQLMVYQRDRTRRLLHTQDIVSSLRNLLPDWHISFITHSDSLPPCLLVQQMQVTDLLVTPHGFQTMLALFMPPGGLVFEVFPFRYFKPGYGPMLAGLGLAHAFTVSQPQRWLHTLLTLLSTPTCMRHFSCRVLARSSDVAVTSEDIARLTSLARSLNRRHA